MVQGVGPMDKIGLHLLRDNIHHMRTAEIRQDNAHTKETLIKIIFRQGGGIHDRNVTYNTHSLNDIQDASIKVINLSS